MYDLQKQLHRTLHQSLSSLCLCFLGVGLWGIGAMGAASAEVGLAESRLETRLETRLAAVNSAQSKTTEGNPGETGVVKSRLVSSPNLPPIQPLLPEVRQIRLVLKLQERRLYIYDGEQMTGSYPVAVGKAGWETPVGEFQVLEMVREPGWTNPFTQEVVPPGPDNPLGVRWIAFWTDGNNYVGFHGTPNRESVGQPASHGCVRMFNEHVQELYERVQIGTPVIVEP